MKKLDEGTKVNLFIIGLGIFLLIGMMLLPNKKLGAQTIGDIPSILNQTIQLDYDSDTILLRDKEIEVAVKSKVVFDATGFTLYSSDKIYSYLVTGSEFDEIPTRRFYDTGQVLEQDTTKLNTTMIYGVVGYNYVQVAGNQNSTMPIISTL